jgi:membrane fusion protein (multidrug efflux system)
MAVTAPPRPAAPGVDDQPGKTGGEIAPPPERHEATPPASRGWRRTALWAVLIPVVVIAAIFLARWIAFGRTHATTDDAIVDGDLYSVNARVGGHVARVYVSENDPVRRGELLVELDPSDLRAQLEQARAALATAQATAQGARTGIAITQTTTSSTTRQAQASLEAAGAQAEAAREQVRVGDSQVAAAEASLRAVRESVNDARNNVRSTQAQEESARAALAAAEEAVDAAQQQVGGAEAGVRAAQASVDVAAADVQAAVANARRAIADRDRTRELFRQGAIAQSQLDAAEAAAATGEAQAVAARQRQAAAQAAVEQARAALAVAQSGVKQAIARRNQARAAVSQAQAALRIALGAVRTAEARVAEAQAGAKQARSNLAGLHADAAQQQAKVAQAQASLQGTTAAPEQVRASRAQAQTATAQVQQAQAHVQEVLLQLSYTRITAPHDGVVSRKNVSVGQTVQASQALMAVVDLRTVYATANFKETQLDGMRVGSPAEFTVDAYPGHVFRGHVRSMSPGTGSVFSLLPPENATGNFTKVVQRVPIRIAIDEGADTAHPLRLGMSVVVTVTTGS